MDKETRLSHTPLLREREKEEREGESKKERSKKERNSVLQLRFPDLAVVDATCPARGGFPVSWAQVYSMLSYR